VYPESDDMKKSIAAFAANVARAQAIEQGTSKFKLKNPEDLVKRFEAALAKWDGLLKGVDRSNPQALAKLLKDNLYSKIDAKTYGVY